MLVGRFFPRAGDALTRESTRVSGRGALRRALAGGTALCYVLALPGVAVAGPEGGSVAYGGASIAQSGSTTTVTQTTDRAVLDWQRFNLGQNESAHFAQPSSSAVAVNRIHDTSASVIQGSLSANGQVVLVNPSGVLFAPGSRVDVQSLVASTASPSDADAKAWAQGQRRDLPLSVPGAAQGTILNAGSITAGESGLVGFVAPNVVNDGVIAARLGKVHLASGDTATLDLAGDGLVTVAVSDATTQQLVANHGLIQAEGGTVLMSAAAGAHVASSVINMDGVVQARSLGSKNGRIVLMAEGSNAVQNNDASLKGTKSGQSTVLVSGVLDASGRNSGERGGSITVTGDNVALLSGALLDASGHSGASGTTAGKAVSAHRRSTGADGHLTDEGSAGGEILIGGDYLGQGATPTAKNLYVDSGALILNDALSTGDAGRSIFWSDQDTAFYGNVYARALGGQAVDPLTWHATAGGSAGDGGFVETSGHRHLDAGGYVDLTASAGNRGTYFLDPTDITIYGNVDPSFVSTDGTSINLGTNLKVWFDASDTTKVQLTYNSLGTTATGTSGANTITVSANTGLVVGARIRLGGAGSVTAASTVGADTYTIAGISGTTITLTSNLTTNYTGSAIYQGYVSQLTDKSSAALNAVQATVSKMPLWVSNGQNGIGEMYYNGSNSLVASGFTGFSQALTVDYIARNNNSTGIIGGWGGTWWGYVGSKMTASAGGGVSYAITPTNWNVVSLIFNGASSTAQVNGGSQQFVSPGTNGVQSGSFEIGSFNGGTTGWAGDIAETLLYNVGLTANAQTLLNQYQSAKWGIALTPPGTGATEAAKATASDGYSVFTTRYLERLSQSADISLQATNNINLDLKGDTLNFTTAGRSLTLTAGNQITTASAGAITTNGGAITFNAANGIVLSNALTLTSNGGAINLNNAVTNTAAQTMNAGSGTLTFASTVNGAGNITANAGTLALNAAWGGTTPLGTVDLTSASIYTLPALSAANLYLNSSASGTIGQSTAFHVTNLALSGANVYYSFTQPSNSLALLAGNANRINIRADGSSFDVGSVNGINGLTTVLGVNFSTGGTVTQSQTMSGGTLNLSGTGSFRFNLANNYAGLAANMTGSGILELNNGANNLSILSATYTGVTAPNVYLKSTGSVTQTQAIVATNLLLEGAGGYYNLRNSGNAITTLAANTGTMLFEENSGWDIGTVNGVNGLTVSSTATLYTNATATQSQAITASLLQLSNNGIYQFNLANNITALTASMGGSGVLSLNNGANNLSISAGSFNGVTVPNLYLTGSGTVTGGQKIVTTNLLLQGSATYNLTDSSNAITTLAASGTGTVNLREDSGYDIGTVNGVSGLTANNVYLSSTGTVTQSQPITATNLKMTGTGGVYTLTNTGNVVSTMAGNTGAINYSNGNTSFTVGSVNGTNGITSTGSVTLRAGTGTITSTQAMATGSGSLLLQANDLVLGANLSGTGTLTLRPSATSQIINLGAGAGGFNLSTTEIGYLVDGWSSITFGSGTYNGSAGLNIGTSTWKDPVSFLSSNGLNISGTLTGTGDAAFTFLSNGNHDGSGTIVTAGGNVVFSYGNAYFSSMSITTNGGAFSSAGYFAPVSNNNAISINTGGGNATFSTGVASGATNGSYTVNAGSGTITMGGGFNLTGTNVTMTAGGYNLTGAWGTLGTVSVTGTNTSFTMPNITSTGNVTLNAGTGTLTLGSVATGSGNLTVTADGLSLGGNLSGTGALLVQPSTASQTMNINNGTSGLYLTTAMLNYLQAGWSSLTFGNSSLSGGINVGPYNWLNSVTFLTNTSTINLLNGTSTLANNASFSAYMAGNGGGVSAGTTTINTSGTGSIYIGAGYANGSMLSLSNLNLSAAGTGNIFVSAGGVIGSINSITTQGGTITLRANASGGSGTVLLTGSTVTSNGGDIILGGGANALTGYAAGYSGSQNGIALTGATINAGGGNITLNGLGYVGSGISGNGVLIKGSTLSTTGSGKITINGIGGSNSAATTNNAHGIFLTQNGAVNSSITTVDGDILLNGSSREASTTPSAAIAIGSGTVQTTGTGNIVMTATNIGSALGRLYTTGGSLISGGNISYIGDTLDASNYAATWNAAGSIILRPYTAATTIGIGSGGGTLSITDNWLSKLTWGGNLWLGGYGNPGDVGYVSNAGNMTMNVSRSFAGNINFLSGGNILAGGGVTTTGAGNILFASLADISTIPTLTASGTGSVRLLANNNIYVGNITTQGGAIILNSDRDASGAGAVSVNNTLASNGGAITIGGGLNPLTDYAFGTSGFANGDGVLLSNSTISAGGGDINIHGRGWNDTSCTLNCYGIHHSGSNISTTGSGSIFFDAINGGASSTNNYQIALRLDNGSVTAVNGSINLTGYLSHASLNSSYYSLALSTPLLTTGTGNINITTHEANTAATGFRTYSAASITSGGNITWVGGNTYATNQASWTAAGDIILRPYNAGTTVGVGSGPGSFALNDTFLSLLSWGSNLWIGGYGNPGDAGYISNAGDMTIRETRSFAKNINFLSAGNILTSGTGTVTTTGAGNILLAALGDINLSTAQNFTAAGTGSITERANGNIIHSGGGVMTTNGGAITLNSDRDGDNSGAIVLSSASNLTSNGGAITLGGNTNPITGAATGNSSYKHGVSLTNSTLNAGGGAIQITGTGYAAGATGTQNGIALDSSTVQTTGTGSITMTGVGGGTASGNGIGIGIGTSSGSVGSTVSTQNGNITMTGTGNGGASSSYNYGISVTSSTTAASKIQSTGSGNIALTGTSNAAGGNTNYGIILERNSASYQAGVYNTSGTLTLTGTKGAGGTSYGIGAGGSLGGAAIGNGSSTGAITLIADVIGYNATAPVIQTTGDVVIRPKTAGTTVGIGTGAGTLAITDNWLSTITWGGNLWLGGYGNPGDAGYVSNAGNMTIIETRSFAGNINFLSAGNILSSGTVTNTTITTTGAGNILLAALGDINFITARNFTAAGTGTITERANGNILHSGGGVITTNGGAITLNADRDADGVGGIALTAGSNLSSSGGNITLGGGTNPLTTTAFGTTASSGDGIYLATVTLNAGGGNIVLNGNGLNDGNGYRIGVATNGATLQTNGNGSISLYGTRGNTMGSSYGIYPTASNFLTANGSISLITDTNSTMRFSDGNVLRTTGAASTASILIDAPNTSSLALWFCNSFSCSTAYGTSTTIATVGGDITIRGNITHAASNPVVIGDASTTGTISLLPYNTLSVLSGFDLRTSGNIVVRPLNAGTSMGIGGGAGALNISDTFLSGLTFGNLWLGGYGNPGDVGYVSNAGNMTIGETRSFAGNINFLSAGDILSSGTGTVTTTGAGNILLAALGDINLSTAQKFTAAGTGSITERANGNIIHSSGGVMTTNGGAITLNSDRDGDNSGAISLGSGSNLTSNGGAITLGGGSNPLTGYAVGNATLPQGIALTSVTVNGGTNGVVTLNGRGYAAGIGTTVAAAQHGILLNSASVQTGGTGTLSVNGTGGGTGVGVGNGVMVYNSSTLQTANGDLSVAGVGGGGSSSGNLAYGIAISNTGTNRIQSLGSGAVNVTGTGGTAASNIGVLVNGSSTLIHRSGTLTVTGIGGLTGPGIGNSGGTLSSSFGDGSSSGNIVLITDRINFGSYAANNFQTTGDVVIRPYTAGTTVGIGAGAGTLALTTALLGSLTYGGNLWLGGYGNPGNAGYISNAGDMTINSNAAFTKNVNFLSAENILSSGTGTITSSSAANILLAALGDINLTTAQNFTASGTGSITERANGNISHAGGATMTTNGGAITLNADRDASGLGSISLSSGGLTSNGGNIILGGGTDPLTTAAVADATALTGIYLTNTTLNANGTASGGVVSLRGQGYITSGYGISLSNSVIQSNFGGALSFTGTASTTGRGIQLQSGSRLTTVNGDIGLAGAGGSFGIVLSSTGSPETIQSTGSGNITLNGVGSGGYGVYLNANGHSILGGTGNVTFISSNSVTLSGTIGNAGSSGTLSFIANTINPGTSTARTSGDIVLRPYTAGTTIGVGAGAGTLSLSDTLLGGLTWGGTLWLGGYGANSSVPGYVNNAGNMNINAPSSFAGNVVFMSAGNITQSGAVTGTGSAALTYNAGNQFLTGAAGSITSASGAINLTATNGIALTYALPITSTSGNINLNSAVTSTTAQSFNAGTGTLTAGSIAVGANDLTLTADDLVLNGTLSGTGIVTLQPYSGSRHMCVNWSSGNCFSASNLFLSTTEVGYLTNGWSEIDLGQANGSNPTGYVFLGTSTWNDPLVVRGYIQSIASTVTGQDNASITMAGTGRAAFGTSGNITTAGSTITLGYIALAAGTASTNSITSNGGAISLGNFTNGGNSSVQNFTVTSGGGAISLTNGISANSAVTGNLSFDAGTGAFTLASTTDGGYNVTVNAGSIALGTGAWGASRALGAVSLTSASSLTLPSLSAASLLVRTTGAAADVTIGSGKVLTASGSGNALVLAAGRNFINNAGSGALALSGGGRWLVYATSPAGSTGEETLANNFNRYSCAYAAGGACAGGVVSVPGTGNGLLYSYTPILTATPNAQNVTYGDAATLAGYGYSLSGYLGTDGSTDAVTGSLTASSAYAAGADIGSYDLTYASGTLASALGYGFTYASAPTAITVGKRTLTASLIGSTSKTYDGTTNATLSAGNYSLANLYAPDTGFLALLTPTTGTYDNRNAGTGKTVTVTGLSLLGSRAGNYQLASGSIAGSIGTILARTLTVSLTGSVSKTYDTTNTATLAAGNYSIGNRVGTDDVTLNNPTSGTYDDAHADSGKTVTVTGLALGGTDAGNYVLAAGSVAGNVGTITPYTLTAGLTGSVSKTYDGTTNASLTGGNYTLTAALGADAVSLAGPSLGSYDNRNAGSGKTVTVSGLVLTGANAGDYQLASGTVSGAIGAIQKATVTASLTGSVSKQYDGTTAATLSAGNYLLSGILGTDSLSLTAPTSGSYGNRNVGSGKSVSVSGLGLTGADLGNYQLAATSLTAPVGQITPKSLSILGITAQDKVYDGSTDAVINAGSVTFSGRVGSEDVTLNQGTLTGAFVDAHAGIGKIVTVSGFSLAGADAGNYTLDTSSFSATTATITPASLTVAALAAQKVEGQLDPALTYTYVGLVGGDTAASFTGQLGRALGETAGQYLIGQGSLAATGDYAIGSVLAAFFTITPAPVVVPPAPTPTPTATAGLPATIEQGRLVRLIQEQISTNSSSGGFAGFTALTPDLFDNLVTPAPDEAHPQSRVLPPARRQHTTPKPQHNPHLLSRTPTRTPNLTSWVLRAALQLS